MEYHAFSEDAVSGALAAAQSHNETFGVATAGAKPNLMAGGEFSVLAQCISLKVGGHKVCLKLPLGIGNVCLPIPINVPNGTAAEACLSICTTWGLPTGVKVTVSALGHVIVTKKFGKC